MCSVFHPRNLSNIVKHKFLFITCSISSEAMLPRSEVLLVLISPEGSLERLALEACNLLRPPLPAVSTEFSLKENY